MSGEEWQGVAAVVTAIGVLIGGIVSSRKTAKQEQHKVETGPIPVAAAPAVENLSDKLDSDGVTKFIEMVLKESGDVRDRVARLEGEVESLKRNETTFRGALGRWLGRVYAAWGHQGVMPMPESVEDLNTLRDVLPR